MNYLRTKIKPALALLLLAGMVALFGEPVEIERLPDKDGEFVAHKTDTKFPGGFDGTIGSIFVDLETMQTRYGNCSDVEKAILKSIKRLYDAGVYRGKEIFSIDRIKHVCLKKDEIEKTLRKEQAKEGTEDPETEAPPENPEADE